MTIQNWVSNLRFFGDQVPNPIKEDYPGKHHHFKLHNGFQLYVLRQRMDTQQPWHQTICDLVDYYGKMLLAGTYHLMVSGHSLGGACATLFGFYASTYPRMIQHGPVIVESFAAPVVGCPHFADAFRHQPAPCTAL